jgi:uncharacterized membrane protein
MEEVAPSNAVLLVSLEALKETMLANQTQNHEAHQAIVAQDAKDHAAIILQTTTTNGTVKKHDKLINMIIGGLIVSNAILVPSVLILFAHYINSK